MNIGILFFFLFKCILWEFHIVYFIISLPNSFFSLSSQTLCSFSLLKIIATIKKKHWKPWCVFCVGQHHLCIHPCWIVFDNSTIPLNISPPKKLSVANNSLAIGGTLYPLPSSRRDFFFLSWMHVSIMHAVCYSLCVHKFINPVGSGKCYFLKIVCPF